MKRGGYIKFDKDMAEDPRLLDAAHELTKRYTVFDGETALPPGDQLRFQCNAVTGGVVTLWKYADVHLRADNSLPMQSAALDAMVGIAGFFEVITRDWVDELEDGTLVLPGYCEKNSLIAKKKATAKSNARVAAFRAKQKVNGNGHVTEISTVTVPKTGVTKVVDPDPSPDLKKRNTHSAHSNGNGEVTALHQSEPWHEPDQLPNISSQVEHSARFFALKADYPSVPRADWIGAQKFATQLVLDGQSTWDELHAAVKAYAAFCIATNRMVMNPREFFHAIDMPWANAWTIPEQRARPAKPAPRVAKSTAELEADEAKQNASH